MAIQPASGKCKLCGEATSLLVRQVENEPAEFYCAKHNPIPVEAAHAVFKQWAGLVNRKHGQLVRGELNELKRLAALRWGSWEAAQSRLMLFVCKHHGFTAEQAERLNEAERIAAALDALQAGGEEKEAPATVEALKAKTAKTPGAKAEAVEPPEPLLTGYRAIFAALGRSYSNEAVRQFKGACKSDSRCPIVFHRNGGPPKVKKSELLAWANQVDADYEAMKAKQGDASATTGSTYKQGRKGVAVVKDISGTVRRKI
ncbi:MAG: hypothetical protein AMXMBFR7_26700 [Planctomycetota bacterium]